MLDLYPGAKQHPIYDFIYATVCGKIFSTKTDKIIGSLSVVKNRWFVTLSKPGQERNIKKYRSTLVWECHNSRLVPLKHEIDHINSDSTDDRPINLQCLTIKEHKLKTLAALKKFTRLATDILIRATHPDKSDVIFKSVRECVKKTKISKSQAYKIKKGPIEKDGWTLSLYNPDLQGEEWRSGIFEGREWTASNKGRVINHRTGMKTFGRINHLYRYIGKKRVHRIVCTIWNGLAPSPVHVVDHLNEDKSDNRPENLEWVLSAENTKRFFCKDIYIQKIGSNEQLVFRTRAEAAAYLGVVNSAISNCANKICKTCAGHYISYTSFALF